MNVMTNHATEVPNGSRWSIGLAVMLFSLVVLAENYSRLDITLAFDDSRLAD